MITGLTVFFLRTFSSELKDNLSFRFLNEATLQYKQDRQHVNEEKRIR